MTTTIDREAAAAAEKELTKHTNYGPREAAAIVLDGGPELCALIAGAVADSRKASVHPRRAIQTTLASFARQRAGRPPLEAATLGDVLKHAGLPAEAFPLRGTEVESKRVDGGVVSQLAREDLAEASGSVAVCPACKVLLEHMAAEDAGGFLTWRCPVSGCGHTRLIIDPNGSYPPAGVGR